MRQTDKGHTQLPQSSESISLLYQKEPPAAGGSNSYKRKEPLNKLSGSKPCSWGDLNPHECYLTRT